MQNESSECEDFNMLQFISELRQEALYISSEKSLLQDLNGKVQNKTNELLQSTWVANKKRLSLLPQREFTPQSLHGILSLNSTEFVEAKTVVGFQNAGKLGKLLQIIRTEPKQLAQWLIIGEQLNDEQTHMNILQSIVCGLYSSLIFPEDLNYMLILLHELSKYQLFRNEKPQRAIKQRANSFESIYYIFHEVLLPARYFLSAALEVPILRLLTIDYYLDIDPEKSLMRFHQDEKLRSLFKTSADYRIAVIQKLAEITNEFVLGLKDNSLGFPKQLSWLVYQISYFILESFDEKEANAVLTELVFSMFICPAIVNPLQYGICDAQIIPLSRHNLMQVGQIIQSLALIKYETPDSKVKDLYDLINKDFVVYLMDEIFTQWKHNDTPPVDVAPFIHREAALFTEQEIRNLVDFLQKVYAEIVQNKSNEGKPVLPDSLLEQLSVLGLDSMEQSLGKQEKVFNGQNDNNLKKSSLFSLVTRPTNSKILGEVPSLHNTVLIFPIRTDNIEPVGMLSERTIIKKNIESSDLYSKENKMPQAVDNHEVQKSYNYQDEGSTGNASDNLEAISEGASNHSVSSSLELENEDQNDNYSDMLSANVSGRGSPNISGRDTPSSQVNENEDRASSGVRQADNTQSQQSSQAMSRQSRSEIDDKFCKFEIKLPGPGRDETTSLVSETWSTDVLGSDNETVDAGDSRNDQQCYSLIDQPIREIPIGGLLDTSETQSESAWSTDVMASDTERLTEIDNDDTGSIAQSDDTNSIAPSDDTRSETDENLLPGSRRLSSSSNSFMNQSNLASNYQEIRRLESRMDQSKISDKNRRDSNANVIIKSLSYSIAQNSYIEQSSEIKTQSTSSFVSKIQKSVNGIEKAETNAGAHGCSNELTFMKQNRKYDERTSEILRSNSSLNSSSSGSSSNSLENKTQNEISEKWESKFHSSQSSLNVTSTPSESTSELSVLSVTNLISPVNLLKKPGTSTSRIIKTSNPSTGAIPKSISFDISADKGDKYSEDDYRSKRASFFGKLKMGFRNRRGKSFRHSDDMKVDNDNGYSFNNSNINAQSNPMKLNNDLDSSDQILEKYRTKPFEQASKLSKETPKMSRARNISESTVVSNNSGDSFKDIKNKLRMVLSYSTIKIPEDSKSSKTTIQDKIETILRMELGKARKLRHWSNVARISETLRCIQLLNEKHCKKIVKSMKNDILKRFIYMQYLSTSRKDLLLSVAFLDELQSQIHFERDQCEEYLATLFVDDYLRRKEAEVNNFCDEFKQLSLSDEKCDILHNFYISLYSDMKKDAVWNEMFKERKRIIRATLERYIISRVYENALYPNGDGDRDRDRVLYEHIERLSNIITPDHKYLMIHKSFLRECPWLPAQEALKAMSAFRTPKDIVNCVIHCAKCIMDLLSMAQNGSTTADDFTPVLVFVIVKSNPMSLLSTIQFVNSFYQDQLCGEEQYWWTQFCAAVEFIKTMDYSE